MQSLSSYRTPPTNKTVGIEWECILTDGNYLSTHTYYGFFYCVSDGSITSGLDYGREFVSQPLQPKWLLKELTRLNKTFKEPIQWNESCGIHVHVSRKWATKQRVTGLVKFLEALSVSEYEDAFGREPNRFCYHQLEATGRGRCVALNLENKATVEFRVFSSGNVQWAQYCVKLVEYMVENAKHLNKEAFFAFVDMHKPI